MKFVSLQENVLVEVSVAELQVLSNTISEAIEAVDDWEFGTRLGASKPEAKQLRADIREALREASLALDSDV